MPRIKSHRQESAAWNGAVVRRAVRGPGRQSPLQGGRRSETAPVPVSLPQDSPPPCVPSPPVQAEDDPGQEEAITIIQSILRAHLARIRHR